MADPVADNADFAVDELKRKARRRLIGAIVIALAAATVLPMLLEQEQKPLGDDVSVQIPPVDSGRFVSRIKGDKAKDAPPGAKAEGVPAKAVDSGKPASAPIPADSVAAPVTAAAPAEPVTPPPAPDVKAAAPDAKAAAPDAKVAAADAKVAAPDVKVAAPDAKVAAADTKPPAQAAAKTPGAADRAREPKQEPKAVPAAPPNPALASAATLGSTGQDLPPPPAAAAAAAAGSPALEAPRAGTYVVQVAAFTDNYGANALAGKLKKSGYPAYTEPVETRRATLWRVRVGGYPTRQAAGEARARLEAEGYRNGVVTPAK